MFAKVLIPTDLSAASSTAVERVGEVPGVREVVLVHALRSAGLSPTDEDALRRMQDLVQRQGLLVEVVIVEDDGTDVPERVLRTARETGADL
ncbi:MAG: hypothetical protein PWR25_1547, partial [Euryarchaeota archaeon]|nr:hypothetical protein [Euryarchaeota archaeon]